MKTYLDKGAVSKIKKYCKNYIYELFRISQCKTGNEFRKSQQPDFSGGFWLFLYEWLFCISEILVNE